MAEKEQTQSGLDLAVKTGTAAKPIIANESVLAQMEQLYKDKLARSQSFLQDMADAQAWWSGGVEGPSRPLAERARTRAAQEKDLEELARGIATTKVGLGQLQEAGQALQPGGTSAPVMGGGAPTAGGTTLPAGWATIRGVAVPPEVAASYQAYLRVGDITRANAVLTEYAKTRGAFLNKPETFKQEPFWDESQGRTVRKMPYEIQQETLFGGKPPVAAPAPAAATAPVAAPAPSAASQVADVYRFENLSAPQQARLKTEFTNLGLQGTVEDLFNRSPMEKRKAAFEASGETSVVKPTQATTSTAPVSTAEAPVAKRRFASPSEEEAFNAAQKEGMTQQAGKAGQKVGEIRGAFETAASEARENLQSTNVMLNIIDEYPEAIGLGYKNRALGAVIEGGKLLFGKDIEPLARRIALSPEAIEAGNKFDSLAERNNLKFRQDVYKGTGQVSDFETKLSERAAGLARDNSVEANRFFAVIAGENYRTLDKLGKAWDDYKNTYGAGADFAKFKQSDIWKKAQDERENRLKKMFPEIGSEERGFGQKTPQGLPKDRLNDLRSRYITGPQ